MKTTRIIIVLNAIGQLKTELTEERVQFVSPKEYFEWNTKLIYSDVEKYIIIVGNTMCERIADKVREKKNNGMQIEIARYSTHPLTDEKDLKKFDHHIERTQDDNNSLVQFIHEKTGKEKHIFEPYISTLQLAA